MKAKITKLRRRKNGTGKLELEVVDEGPPPEKGHQRAKMIFRAAIHNNAQKFSLGQVVELTIGEGGRAEINPIPKTT